MKQIGFNIEDYWKDLASYLAEVQELMQKGENPGNTTVLEIERVQTQLNSLKYYLRLSDELEIKRGKVKQIEFNIEDCRNALESYLTEVQELMQRIEDPENMTMLEIEEAQIQLNSLKYYLRADNKLRSTVETMSKVTEVEKAIFWPTIFLVLTNLNISVSSLPNPQWFSKLYKAESIIQYALESLEKWGVIYK